MSDRVCNIYRSQLNRNGHGQPFWYPEPDTSGEEEYVETGVCPGDVGILNDSGGFDFLFNIFKPAGHPRHGNNVPPDFVPLAVPNFDAPGPMRQIEGCLPHVVLSRHLSSSEKSGKTSVMTSSSLAAEGTYHYSTSKDHAATLSLPVSATRYDFMNIEKVKRYIMQNWESWYDYATNPDYCGRSIPDKSFYVVTGCDKTKKWTTAVVTKLDETQKLGFTLNIGATNGELTSCATCDPGVINETRTFPDDSVTYTNTPGELENQCVFARGYTITPGSPVTGLLSLLSRSEVQLERNPAEDGKPSRFVPSMRRTSNAPSSGSHSGSSSSPTGTSHSVEQPQPSADSAQESTCELEHERHHSICDKIVNPSLEINTYLLTKYPAIRLAISHDDDWINVMKEYGDDHDITDHDLWCRIRDYIDTQYQEVDFRGSSLLPETVKDSPLRTHSNFYTYQEVEPDNSCYTESANSDQTQQATQSTQQPSQANPVDVNLWGILQPCNANNPRMEFSKTSPTIRIGRNPQNAFVLPGARVSNQHCEIVWDEVSNNDTASVTVVDRSTNGTFINGFKIGKGHQRLLHDGNEIAFGTVIPQGPNSKEDYRYIFRMVAGGDKLEGVYADYEVAHELGKGAFATVVKAMSRKTGEWVAVKMIREKRPQGSTSVTTTQTQLNREINLMASLSHPNICAMKGVYYHQDGSINLVLELVEGGDLLDYITTREGLSEDVTRHIAWQLCDALAYVHSLGVTHRDLKPENVLMTKDDPPIVKVADFGLAKVVDSLTMLRTMCGTPSYLAPEVVRQENHQGYDNLVDSWSVGVIVYSMLTNTAPFIEDENQPDIRTRIAERWIHWQPLENHSREARSFIQALLETDPTKRMTMVDSRKHPWLAAYTPIHDLRNQNSDSMDQDPSSTPANKETNDEAPVPPDVSMKSNGDADGEAIVSGQMDNLQLDAPTSPQNKTGIPRQGSRLERRSDVLLRAEEEGWELLQPSQEMVSREEKQRELQESEFVQIDAIEEGSSKKRPFSDLEAVAEVDEASDKRELMDITRGWWK